jgi:hypothetical protein
MKYTVEMGSGTKFHKDWFRHSEAVGMGIRREADGMVIP